MRPPSPRIVIDLPASSAVTSNPSFCKPSIITRVSSANSALSKRHVAADKAASTIARFVRLFDPGGEKSTSNGLAIGSMRSCCMASRM
jgi:hypothetical protein